jgi:hypothetical protein
VIDRGGVPGGACEEAVELAFAGNCTPASDKSAAGGYNARANGARIRPCRARCLWIC